MPGPHLPSPVPAPHALSAVCSAFRAYYTYNGTITAAVLQSPCVQTHSVNKGNRLVFLVVGVPHVCDRILLQVHHVVQLAVQHAVLLHHWQGQRPGHRPHGGQVLGVVPHAATVSMLAIGTTPQLLSARPNAWPFPPLPATTTPIRGPDLPPPQR